MRAGPSGSSLFGVNNSMHIKHKPRSIHLEPGAGRSAVLEGPLNGVPRGDPRLVGLARSLLCGWLVGLAGPFSSSLPRFCAARQAMAMEFCTTPGAPMHQCEHVCQLGASRAILAT